MTNIRTALFPLLFLLCLCGFGVFEYQGQPRLRLTVLYILAMWLLHVYVMVKTKRLLDTFTLDFPLIMKVSVVFTVMYMLIILYYYKRFMSCLNRLSVVNNTLERLGTPKNYAKLRTRVIWLIVGWMIVSFMMDIVDNVWFIMHTSTFTVVAVCLPYIINHTLHINALYDFTFMALLGYIGSRFECVNRHIQELTERKKQQARHAWATCISSSLIHRHTTGTEAHNQVIWILMHIHLELSSILRELTTMSGLQIMMQTAAFQIFTVQLIIELYTEFKSLNSETAYVVICDVFVSFIWAVTNIIKMLIFNHICEQICIKARRTEVFLNRLANLTFDVETQENITQFLLLLLKRPPRISVFGLYYGYELAQQMIGWIAKIVILVIQSGI